MSIIAEHYNPEQARSIADRVAGLFDEESRGLVGFTVYEVCIQSPSGIANQFIESLLAESGLTLPEESEAA